MQNKVEQLVHKWAVEENDDDYRRLNNRINFLADHLFFDYEPIQTTGKDFLVRLEEWILNLTSNDDRKTLFKLLSHLYYFGQKEFNGLYQVAYNEIIVWWLLRNDNIDFKNLGDSKKELKQSILKTWICPITDSMKINSFYHINNIPGNHDYRPQWYNSDKNWNTAINGYVEYFKLNGYKRLVLLEDFVGSGSQIYTTVEYIMNLKLDIPVLLLPLIICPAGIKNFNELEKKYSYLSYQSVLELPENSFVLENGLHNEPDDFKLIRNLMERIYKKISGGKSLGTQKPYSPFGYGKTGGLIVMYTNTPDNTLPAIHFKSKTWTPIFERHSRN